MATAVATAVAAPAGGAEEISLSCQGYRYGGIDWDEVRDTLEVFGDKYLDRPQLLSKEFQLASTYALEYHPENKCKLGDLALRLMLWLQARAEELSTSMDAVLQGRGEATNMGPFLEETYGWFWELPWSFSSILKSKWPIFSLLDAASSLLQRPGGCFQGEVLEKFLDTFWSGIYIPSHVSIDLLLNESAASCIEARASALLSLADNQRYSPLSPTGVQGNRYYRSTAMPKVEQPSEEDSDRLVARAEQMLRSSSKEKKWDFLTRPWPVWRLLDRVGNAEVVNVTTGRGQFFWMYVFPHRVRSDGIISNRIRGRREGYCLQQFQDEAVRRFEALQKQTGHGPARPLRLIEAGPHLGDCLLWAAAVFGADSRKSKEQLKVRSTAIEPVDQVVDRFRRSILANNFDIDLRHAWLGEKSRDLGPDKTPWVALDDIIPRDDGDVDIFKIHTNGGERAILDGAKTLFSTRKVHVVLVHSAEDHQLWGSAAFLLDRGYTLTINGKPIAKKDEALVKKWVKEKGGLQLHALHPDAQ